MGLFTFIKMKVNDQAQRSKNTSQVLSFFALQLLKFNEGHLKTAINQELGLKFNKFAEKKK